MYPINAASPERIGVGAVVQISDGAVQTSGVTVSVTKQGGAETGSAGTIAYSTGGIVFYTPTQAETNATSFIVTAYKTGCIPVAVTIVTSASSTPGNAGLDWGAVINKTTTNALTGTTIATSQVVASVSGAVGSVTGAVGSVTGAVGSVTGSVGSVTGSVGSVTGSVGSVTGAVGSVTAAVTVGTNNDKTGYRLSATGVDDVLDEAVEGSTTLRQSQRLQNAAAGGKASGLETTNAKYRDLADTKDRIDATVDADGNRTALTLDLT